MKNLDEILAFLGSEKVHGSGKARMPSPLDDLVTELLSIYEQSTVDVRKSIFTKLNELHGWVLVGFAERMASHAVRIADAEPLRKGLLALMLAVKLIDPREAVMIFSLLCWSLAKLGLDEQTLPQMAAGFGEPQFAKDVQTFVDRPGAERSILRMGFGESSDQDGFRYHWLGFP